MNTLIETAKTLSYSERIDLAMGILASLNTNEPVSEKPKKATKAPKAPKEPKPENAPKKEVNWFVRSLAHVREVIKPLIENYNASLSEGSKKLAGTAAPLVGRILKEANQLSSEVQPTDAQINDAFKSLLSNPPTPKTKKGLTESASEPKPKAEKKPKVKKNSKVVEPFTPMPFYNHAFSRGQHSMPSSEDNTTIPFYNHAFFRGQHSMPSSEDNTTIETYEWNGDIGNGPNAYERIDYNDISYIYTPNGETFIGEWEEATKTLKKGGYDIKNQ